MGFAHSSSVEFTAYAFLSIHPLLAIKIEQKYVFLQIEPPQFQLYHPTSIKKAHGKLQAIILIMCYSTIISLYI